LYRYWVSLDSVGLTNEDGESQTFDNSSSRVFFDTGATLSYLPSNVIQEITQALNARKDNTVGLYLAPCGQKGSLDFTFGDFTINVALDEFLWDIGNNICALGAEEADGTSLILGDSFLRCAKNSFLSMLLHFADDGRYFVQHWY
jgi:hypothetical protein